MANVVFYITTKFIKIEEKKKVVNIVKVGIATKYQANWRQVLR